MNRGVVLHIEDNDDVRVATCMVVASAGYHCLDASTPEAALDYVREWGPLLDVLIVDYDLGTDMTGTEVVEALTRRLGRSLPTIILTGDPSNAQLPWLRNAPIWIARKPLDPQALVAGLAPLVEFGRAMKQLGAAETREEARHAG